MEMTQEMRMHLKTIYEPQNDAQQAMIHLKRLSTIKGIMNN